MIIAAQGATNPAAGVIATRPATRPDATPSAVGFPPWLHSTATHPTTPPTAPTCVTTNASEGSWPDASALPALNPNHPNQRRPEPVIVIVRLCGSGFSCG